jgi:DNA-nicking Smr family endonuclease
LASDKDTDAFAKAMQGVKPLQQAERPLVTKRPQAKAHNSRAARAALLNESLNGPAKGTPDMIEQLGEEIAFRRPGLPEKTFRKLRRGRFSIGDEADLHGLTVNQAKQLLREFICESAQRELGCVRVIHGKGLGSGPGGPVLKGNVQRWLMQWDEVLAFVTARARDGGSGAVYVLLRHR